MANIVPDFGHGLAGLRALDGYLTVTWRLGLFNFVFAMDLDGYLTVHCRKNAGTGVAEPVKVVPKNGLYRLVVAVTT